MSLNEQNAHIPFLSFSIPGGDFDGRCHGYDIRELAAWNIWPCGRQHFLVHLPRIYHRYKRYAPKIHEGMGKKLRWDGEKVMTQNWKVHTSNGTLVGCLNGPYAACQVATIYGPGSCVRYRDGRKLWVFSHAEAEELGHDDAVHKFFYQLALKLDVERRKRTTRDSEEQAIEWNK